MKKIELNSERELVIQSMWLLPLIPMSVLIIMGIFVVIFIMIVWFITFGYIYYLYHSNLYIYEDKFIIKTIRKEYIINFDEILIINEIKKVNNSLISIKYKIMLKNNTQNIPQKFLIIQNAKFNKIYKEFKLSSIKTSILE